MAVKAYPKGIAAHDKSDWDDAGNTYYVILLQSGSYNNAHEFVADLLAGGTEVTASGYAHKTLGSRTSSVGGANIVLDGADIAYGNLGSGQTMASAAICRQIGGSRNNAVDRLIGFYDGGTSPNAFGQTTNGGPVDIVWPISGILQYQT